MRRPVTLMATVVMAAVSLVLSAQEPAFTRSPRADVRSRLRAAARLGTRYVPGRVLVKFRPGLPTQAQASAVTQALPGTASALRTGDAYSDFAFVDVPLEADVPSLAAALAARPEVEYAEPDAIHHLAVTPTDPSFGRHQIWSSLSGSRARVILTWNSSRKANRACRSSASEAGSGLAGGGGRKASRISFISSLQNRTELEIST